MGCASGNSRLAKVTGTDKKARDLGSRKLLAYFRALQILGYPAELMHRRALASTSVASHY